MAKYKSTIKISGSIGDVTFTNDGTVKPKSSLDKKKWKTHRRMRNSRRSATEFGGACKYSSAFMYAIPPDWRRLARTRMHSYLSQLLAANARKGSYESRLHHDFNSTLQVFHRLDLSNTNAPSAKLSFRQTGHPLHPTEICIHGLRDIADAIPQVKNHEIMFKLHFLFVEMPDVRFFQEPDEWKVTQESQFTHVPCSRWISPKWIPEQGMRIAISNPNPNRGTVLLLQVLWHHSPIGRPANKAPKDAEMQAWSTLKVAAIFRPIADRDLPVPIFMQNPQTKRYRLRKKRYKRYSAKHWPAALKLRLAAPVASPYPSEAPANGSIRFLPPKTKSQDSKTPRSGETPK